MIPIPNEWNKNSIDKASKVIVSPVDKKTNNNETPVELCNYTDVYYNQIINPQIEFMKATATQNEIDKFSLFPEDVIITKDSETPDDIGVSAYVEEVKPNLLCGYHLSILRPNKNTCGKFLLYSLRHPRIRYDFYRYANGVTRFGLAKESYSKIEIPFPPLPEQRAIADILSIWDEAIEKMEKLIKIKENSLKVLIRNSIDDNPKNKNWRKIKYKSIFSPKKLKNLKNKSLELLSVTKNGIVKQSEYFNKEVASKDLSEYLVAHKNDFILSGLNFWMGSVDFQTIVEKGIVSPAYKVFEFISPDVLMDYMKLFIKTRAMKKLLISVSVQGASIVRRNLDNEMLNNSLIAIPSIEEQKNIVEKVSLLEQDIQLNKELLSKYKEQKRGLMQKLLTGEWRVKIH